MPRTAVMDAMFSSVIEPHSPTNSSSVFGLLEGDSVSVELVASEPKLEHPVTVEHPNATADTTAAPTMVPRFHTMIEPTEYGVEGYSQHARIKSQQSHQ